MASNDETDHQHNLSVVENIQAAFVKGGVPAVNTLVSRALDNWKELPINVGVTGNSGVGKSSFINAIRGLSADDDGAAAVGVVETTTKPEPYKHPNNGKLLLWDLPGVGTPTLTRDKYLKRIDVDKYDYFIIVAACRFTENDLWIGRSLKSRNKTFFFVRTKIHNDVRDNESSHPETVIDTIRKDCIKNLVNLGNEVFLIDNYKTNDYDFHKLSDQLIIDAPQLKRESMLFTLRSFSKSLILQKQKALLKRVVFVASLSGICALNPIPGVDITFDICVIVKEANFYKNQFGLLDAALDAYAQQIGTSAAALIRDCDLKTKLIDFSAEGLKTYIIQLNPYTMAMYTSMKFLSYAVPIVGGFIGSTVSLTYCFVTLKSLLDMTVDDALSVSRYTKI